VLSLLVAAAIGAYAAPECPVHLGVRTEGRGADARRLYEVRPSCPLGYDSSREALHRLLANAGGADEVRLHMGRIERYAWLSALLAHAGGGTGNAEVARTLRGIPDLARLFPGWTIRALSVEKVLVKDGRPYDAILWITLARAQKG
jgi:hypothetical protein